MDRDEAVRELKNRIEHDVSEGSPHPDVPSLVTVTVPEREKPIAISEGAMEAAEKSAELRDEDPMDELEKFARESIKHYRDAED